MTLFDLLFHRPRRRAIFNMTACVIGTDRTVVVRWHPFVLYDYGTALVSADQSDNGVCCAQFVLEVANDQG